MVLAEDVWVVQMEGYLLKRGAGFKLEKSDETLDRESKARTRAPSLIRRGTLLRKGSGEKKRYFVLLTKAPENGNGPRAELRYFTTQRDPESLPKGTVSLNVHMRVELYGHSTVCLLTLGRTYYLRPDKSKGEPSSALARVTAGKWIHALKFAINALRSWEMAPSEDVSAALNPLTRLSIMISAEDLAKHQEDLRRALSHNPSPRAPAALLVEEEIDEEETARLNLPREVGEEAATQTRRDMLLASANEYAGLWDNYGLHAYNALVAHFGPVLIDLQRMHDHLRTSVRMGEAEVDLYEAQQHKSQDVAASEQRSTARMMLMVYRSFDRRVELTRKYLASFQDEVLEPVQHMVERVQSELESVVRYHHGTAANFERLYKGVDDMKQSIRELQVEYDNVVNLAPAFGISRLRSRQQASRTPEIIAEDIEAIRSMLVQTQTTLRKEESRHAVRMKVALKALHALDVERLNLQSTVLTRMTELEDIMFDSADRSFADGARLTRVVDDVQPSLDVEATSKRLLAALEN
ncbi:Hypothetical Protein FCC1311_073922 [Hondaea fermentalgiana]|uniref:PH domain-containing protein n=1 Tax=Hondaea fermentalgiana TaxID=2315210 RepID=A0A2R5GS47_9STRA|nr:Hypothetical Protein FCC1311_073922 [Hondaea fermentalgiana]|eukprot:GBG31171.1 Hypothetical Protein FCC1311_073922 [Hondaea fermentalgiana]